MYIKHLPKKPYIRLIPLIEATLKLIDKKVLPKLRFWANTNIPFSLNRRLSWRWIGFCMMLGKPRQLSHLFQWTWEVTYDCVSAQRKTYNFPSQKVHRLNGYHTWVTLCWTEASRLFPEEVKARLAPRPSILLHAVCLVLEWMSKGIQQAARP